MLALRNLKGETWNPPLLTLTMYYVYILRSECVTKQTYIGYTSDLRQRLEQHNQGFSKHTAKFRPWELIFYAAFPDKQLALEFESYLKSHSGKAFTKKRLINPT